MSDPANVVVFKDVEKTFPSRGGLEAVKALRGVNLEIAKGSMVAIKGPSGSGKTTLLNLLGALDLPSAGTVEVGGKDLSKLKEKELTEHRAKTIGFVFQNFFLIPNLTAVENVSLPMEAVGVPSKERRARASELLESVGMGDRETHKPAKLSGGEKQRVAIARALANRPSVILADEPTGNLDSVTGDNIVTLLDKLRKEHGTTVVIVTHSGDVARRCDTTLTIKDGRITSAADNQAMRADEDARNALKIQFAISEKVVDRLVAAGYLNVDSIARAPLADLTEALGDGNRARRIQKKALALQTLNEEKVEE